jgi:hypothetical protein
MKTSLKYLAFFFAVALPGTFAAELAGVSLPASLDPLHALSAFVVVLSVLMLFADYGMRDHAAATAARRAAATKPAKSDRALAA